MRKIIIIGALIFLMAGIKAEAIGIYAKPSSMSVELNRNQVAEKELLVANSFDEPAAYRVYSDDYQDQIKLSPSEFRLYPGENQLIKVTFSGDNAGQKNTNISVVATPLSGYGLVASTGVKIPISLTVNAIWPLVLVLFAACITLIFIVKLLLLMRKPN